VPGVRALQGRYAGGVRAGAAECGIDRSEAYVTNAVRHFKWRPKGKRRLHQTPRAGEIEADLEGVATALQGAAR
jgi:hypothetical protein